jgi:hypothetical protein
MTACQRWNPGRIQSWRRPEDGGFDPARYGVTAISEAPAKTYVTGRHYSGSYPSAIHRYGLLDLAGESPVLVGVAVLSLPASPALLTSVFPGLAPKAESLELGRFVLDDAVPANGESWFCAEVRRLGAAAGLCGIVACSDPVMRTRSDGTVVMPGHIGVIYQASNAVYTGRTTARTHALMPDGTVFSPRAMQKIRAQGRGHRYAEQQLVDAGATPMRPGQRPASWLAQALGEAGARRFRHPGNHRYAWPVGTTRRGRAAVRIEPGRLYPKAWHGQGELDLTEASKCCAGGLCSCAASCDCDCGGCVC